MATRALGSLQDGLDRVWHAGWLGEARPPTLRKGGQGVADGLYATADMRGNLSWRALLGARESNLAPA